MALLTNINGKFSVSDAGAVTFNNAFTFPTTDGTANYILKTNGSGQLAWAPDSNSGDITGSGTANTVTKFTGAKVIGDGPITFSGNNSTFAGQVIASSSSSGDYVRMYGGSGTAQWDIYGNGENLRFSENSGGGGHVDIDTNLIVDGNVGIGTTSPNADLQIGTNDTAGSYSMMIEGQFGNTALASNPRLNLIDGNFGITAGKYGSGTSDDAIGIFAYQGAGRGILFAHTTAGSSTTLQNMRHDMFIDGGTGNVGIGTDSPLKILTVKKATSTTGIATSEVMRLAGTAQAVGNKNELGFANYDFNYNASVVIGAEIMSTAAYLKQDLYFATRESTNDVAPTERMRIDSSGNVGINNSNPSAFNSLGGKNVVIGDGTQTNNLTLYSATTGGGVGYGHIAFADSNSSGSTAQYAGLIQYYHGNDSMQFYTNATPRMTILSSGNVGIGNTSPTLSTLTVGIGSTNNPSQICQLAGSGSGVYSVLSLTNTNGVAADNNGVGLDFHVNAAYSATGRIQLIHPTAQSGASTNSSMQFLTYGTVSGVTTFSPRMTIDYIGNVGIGTTSPSEILHINGGGSGPEIRLQGTWGSHYIRAYNDNWNFLVGGTVQAITIKNNGNVGIGETSPSQKLHVAGNIYVEDGQTTGLGVILQNGDRPMITRGWDAFTSGSYTGIGRWGLFMEVATTFLASPGTDFSNGLVSLGGYTASGTPQYNLTVNNYTRRVGIGTTSPTYKLHVVSSNNVSIFEDTSNASGAAFIVFNRPGVFSMGSITRNGSANSVSYNTGSDYRLKEDLKDFNALDLVNNITAYDYKWKDVDQRDYGFIAHELKQTLPNVVTGEKDGEKMQGVDYSKLTPILLKAIQEQQEIINDLKLRIEQLEN